MQTKQIAQLSKEEVLSKAVLRLSEQWNISHAELAAILGVSPTFISRLKQGETHLSPHKKEGEIALMLIRVFRSLGAFLGDKMSAHHQWLNAYNQAFNDNPLHAMKSVQGLAYVVRYLDAMRGAEG